VAQWDESVSAGSVVPQALPLRVVPWSGMPVQPAT
jgi:hypothetical protein